MGESTAYVWDWDALLADGLRAGLSIEEFWSLTPREMTMTVDAKAWWLEQERQWQRRRDLWLAWHMAALSRAKRLPSLKRLLQPPKTRVLQGAELEQRRQEFAELSQRLGRG